MLSARESDLPCGTYRGGHGDGDPSHPVKRERIKLATVAACRSAAVTAVEQRLLLGLLVPEGRSLVMARQLLKR